MKMTMVDHPRMPERDEKKSNVEKKLMQEIQKANNKTNRKTKQTIEALVWLEPQSVEVGVSLLLCL